jgi:hypothetical protein
MQTGSTTKNKKICTHRHTEKDRCADIHTRKNTQRRESHIHTHTHTHAHTHTNTHTHTRTLMHPHKTPNHQRNKGAREDTRQMAIRSKTWPA